MVLCLGPPIVTTTGNMSGVEDGEWLSDSLCVTTTSKMIKMEDSGYISDALLCDRYQQDGQDGGEWIDF